MIACDSVDSMANQTHVMKGTDVFAGSSLKTVKTAAELASYFGCTTSDIVNHIVPIVYNGDTAANNCLVYAAIENDGRFTVSAETSSAYRIYYYLVYV